MDPEHNVTALLLGTGEFSFSEGAKTVADAISKGFVDFGNINAFTPNLAADSQEHVGSYRGVRRVDKTTATKAALEYTLKCDEWKPDLLRYMFGGDFVATPARSALAAVAADTITVVAPTAGVKEIWYDLAISGVRQRALTAVTVATKTEGTDFWVDLKLGRIKFASTITGAQTPSITGPAIAVGDAAYQYGVKPLVSPVKRGFGRLVVYDQDANNNVALEHVDFSCEVTADNGSEVGSNFSEISIKVKVTETVGTLLVRNDNL